MVKLGTAVIFPTLYLAITLVLVDSTIRIKSDEVEVKPGDVLLVVGPGKVNDNNPSYKHYVLSCRISDSGCLYTSRLGSYI